MVQALYELLSSFENGQSHKRQRSAPVLRLFRQRQTLIRRVAIALVAVSLFCAALLKIVVFPRTEAWLSVPVAPPTPFILKGLPSSDSKLTDASFLAAPFTAPKYRPKCSPISSISSRYASLSASKSNSTIYLALNLLDAQRVLPTFIHELPILLSYMGSHRFHVSILENGSTDLSAGLLVSLARGLAAVGSSYEIVVQGNGIISHKENGRRIVELARLRNAALKSLYNGKAAKRMGIKHFDMVLFMNDIFWCTSDMLEILKQHVVQEAHMTCATDWGSNVVYDRWVARTMSGLPFYSQADLLEYFNGPHAYSPPYPEPLPYDDHERKRFGNLGPFQVFSCWNGAAVIDTRAFVSMSSDDNGQAAEAAGSKGDGPKGSQTQFDSDSKSHIMSADDAPSSHIRFRTAQNDASPTTEKASECFLICVDLWRKGMGRILLVPRASVAYELAQYERVRQDGGRTLPHPIGVELHVHPKAPSADPGRPTTASTGYSSDNVGDADKEMEGIQKVPWRTTPPANVVYHDYAWWHEKERWGPWDEA